MRTCPHTAARADSTRNCELKRDIIETNSIRFPNAEKESAEENFSPPAFGEEKSSFIFCLRSDFSARGIQNPNRTDRKI